MAAERIYVIHEGQTYTNEGAVFFGNMDQFEDCFGGCGGEEDGVHAFAEQHGWTVTICESMAEADKLADGSPA